MVFEKIAVVFASKGKMLHTCMELIRKIMTFEYEELLLLKSPQN